MTRAGFVFQIILSGRGGPGETARPSALLQRRQAAAPGFFPSAPARESERFARRGLLVAGDA